MNKEIKFTIKGEPASKSNSRRLVTIHGKPRFIKSNKGLEYAKAFQAQVSRHPYILEDDVEVEMTIFYASRRPDLDESLILDLLQGVAYLNDRQVKRKVINWGLDRNEPRSEIIVRPLARGTAPGADRPDDQS